MLICHVQHISINGQILVLVSKDIGPSKTHLWSSGHRTRVLLPSHLWSYRHHTYIFRRPHLWSPFGGYRQMLKLTFQALDINICRYNKQGQKQRISSPIEQRNVKMIDNKNESKGKSKKVISLLVNMKKKLYFCNVKHSITYAVLPTNEQ